MIQILFRLGLEITSLNYYLTLQLIIYLPLGILSYFVTKSRISKFFTALTAIFSIYLVNFVSMLVYSFDDPITYIKENQKETLEAFVHNTLLLLPLLIGFIFSAIFVRLAKKYMEKRGGKKSTMNAEITENKEKSKRKKTAKKSSAERTAPKKNAITKKRKTSKKAK